MAEKYRVVMLTVLAVTGSVAAAYPQPKAGEHRPRLQVSVSAGGATLFRIEDQNFGRTLNIGGGAGLRLRQRLWVEVEVNRFLGLEAAQAPCGLVNIACTGATRTGYDSATAGSIALTYHFGEEGVHALVTGGYGFISARGFDTITFASTGQQVERSERDRGWSPTAGVGLRIPVGSHWAIEPTLRLYGADAPNLTAVRGAVALLRTW
jgi:hypothetical protein